MYNADAWNIREMQLRRITGSLMMYGMTPGHAMFNEQIGFTATDYGVDDFC